MVINLDAELETAVNAEASREGVAPEELVLKVLRTQLLSTSPLEPRDDWERDLLQSAKPWGVSLPNSALSSEGLYD